MINKRLYSAFGILNGLNGLKTIIACCIIVIAKELLGVRDWPINDDSLNLINYIQLLISDYLAVVLLIFGRILLIIGAVHKIYKFMRPNHLF